MTAVLNLKYKSSFRESHWEIFNCIALLDLPSAIVFHLWLWILWKLALVFPHQSRCVLELGKSLTFKADENSLTVSGQQMFEAVYLNFRALTHTIWLTWPGENNAIWVVFNQTAVLQWLLVYYNAYKCVKVPDLCHRTGYHFCSLKKLPSSRLDVCLWAGFGL